MRLLQLFGHPLLRTGASCAPIGASPKAIALLALLAEDPSRALSRDRLAETLWPDAPLDEGRSNVRRHLHLLSKLLGGECFAITRSTAQWAADAPVDLDVVLFARWESAEAERAARLYAGDLCETIDDPALDAPRSRLRARYEAMVRREAERACESGDGTPLAGWLERMLAMDPLDEAAARELMRLHAARGDRAQAMRLYNGLAHRLRAELQVAPQEETTALYLSLIHADAPHTGHVPVPPRTFVGRERELERLKSLFAHSRAVTIAGIGGIGKTTLAQRYAAGRLAYFVEAAAAQDSDALWQRLARALDLPPNAEPAGPICRRLSGDDATIVFDACETAPEACAALANVLLTRTKAHLLLTSRTSLGIPGETLLLEPLGLPPADVQTADALLRFPAYRLFVERAAANNAAFRVHAKDIAGIVELLHRLDGIPLAIELLAARTAATPVSELLESYRVARGPRLKAAIAWAYRQLSPRDRRLIESLTAFDGDFSAEAAAGVCGAERAQLETLISAGLLRAQPIAGEIRYLLLDAIREYAQERVEPANAHRAHAEYYAALADSYSQFFSTAEETAYFQRVSIEARNFRAAILWAHENDRALCARLISALCPYYVFRADLRWVDSIACELLPEFEELILTCGILAKARVLRERSEAQLRAAREFFRSRGDRRREIRALHNLAISVFNHNHEAALPLFQELLELQRAEGDDYGAAHSLVNIAAALVSMRRYEDALALHHEAIEIFQRIEYTRGVALTYEAIARTQFSLGRHQEAYDSARAAVTLLELAGDRVWLCQGLRTLASQSCTTSRHDEALAAILRALELLPDVEMPIFHSNVCLTLVDVALAAGDPVGAALAYGKGEAIRRAAQLHTSADYREYLDARIDEIKRHIGSAAFTALAAEGARMEYDALAARLRRPENAPLLDVNPRRTSSG